MVRFTVLASGSKGNSAIVSCLPDGVAGSARSASATRILIDAGLSCRELFRRMHVAGEDPAALDAILITHEHVDHIHGLAVTARKLGIPVYLTEATHRAWVRMATPQKRVTYAEWARQYRARQDGAGLSGEEGGDGRDAAASPQTGEDSSDQGSPGDRGFPPRDAAAASGELPARTPDRPTAPDLGSANAEGPDPAPESNLDPRREAAPEPAGQPAHLPCVRYFRAGQPFSIGGFDVSPFTIPHDAADPVGFVFTAGGVRLAMATDLGYMPPNVQSQLRRCDLILLESNHDLEMLRDGPYPWAVKQRVLSRVGHLSNDATATYLEGTYDGHATYLILAHLSESNNLPELARMAAERALCGKPALMANRLLLASQHEPLQPVCF